MRRLTDVSYILVKAEVDSITPDRARELWSQIEVFWVGVCFKASPRKRDQEWLSLSQKMYLIKRKAEEVGHTLETPQGRFTG